MKKFLSTLATHAMLLALAVALWWYATDKRTAHLRGLRAPIVVRVGENLIVAKLEPRAARLSIRGPRGMVERAALAAKRGDAKVVVDLSGDTGEVEDEKAFRVALTPENVDGMPEQIRILGIRPKHVEVTIVRRVVKRLRVTPQLVGEPAPGFQIVGKPYLQPRKVAVRGPKTLLDAAKEIRTEPIDISGITEEANRTFPWFISVEQILRDAQGKPHPVLCNETVQVYLTVGRLQGKTTVENVAVKILAPPDYAYHVKLKPDRVSLAVSGPKYVLDKMTPADIEAYVNVSALRPAVAPYKESLICRLPPDVQLAQEPPTVEVDVSEPKPERKAKP